MMKLYGNCETCYKKGFFIRNRVMKLNTNMFITSKKMMCSGCVKNLKKMGIM